MIRVVATRAAFVDGHYVRAGEELDVPQGTRGTWFTLPGTPRAEAALRDKAPPRAAGWRTPHTEMRSPDVEVDCLTYNPYARV